MDPEERDEREEGSEGSEDGDDAVSYFIKRLRGEPTSPDEEDDEVAVENTPAQPQTLPSQPPEKVDAAPASAPPSESGDDDGELTWAEIKQQEIDRMLAEGWVLPEAIKAPPSRAPPLPPRKTTVPSEVFESRIQYDASHLWKDLTPEDQATSTPRIHFEGVQVAEKYDIFDPLGSGLTSNVYLGQEKASGRDVAIKVINDQFSEIIPASIWRPTAAKLDSVAGKHVVAKIEQIEENDSLYIILERELMISIPKLLIDALSSLEVVTEKHICTVVSQILRAIRRIHKKGYVYNDLNPNNLMSNDDATNVVLVGFAKTTTSEVDGTLATATHLKAPEILNKEGHTSAIDIWALGCITYYLLSGVWPFYNKNKPQLISDIKAAKVEFGAPQWETVSSDAKDFVQSCLKLAPKSRPRASALQSHAWIKSGGSDAFLEGIRERWAEVSK